MINSLSSVTSGVNTPPVTFAPSTVTHTPLVSPVTFGFFAGGLAACGAVTFTNPWEVVKTRLQLQGECLVAKANQGAGGANQSYRGAWATFTAIFRHEGIRGLQQGLGAAYAYQLLLNGTRLGLYGPTKRLLLGWFASPSVTESPGAPSTDRTDHISSNYTAINATSGMISGLAAAFVGSPLFLVKTRMQSYSRHVAVGHQHYYSNTWSALRQILKQDGVRGLFRGVDAAMLRTGVGSAVQLSTYDKCKETLLNLRGGTIFQDNIYLHSVASLITGAVVCSAMNPFDVVSTRMYNQRTDLNTGKGSLYRNPWHCLITTLRTEGLTAFYKAIIPQYLRLGPHTILMFVFMEQLHMMAKKLHII
ncbi:Mitochondrial oxaloacetate carrier protein [Dispira simplex]|nr:Mitochondrial oxaloacetate carrier protein [Dispira simplex]